MKKTLSLCLVIVMLLVSLVGCDSDTSNKTETSTTKTTSTTEVNKNEISKDVPIDKNKAAFYAYGADGYGIIEHEGALYCVDAKGNVTFKLPEKEKNVTQVYHGVFLTFDGQKARIRKYDGSEITIKDTSENVDILFMAGETYYNPYDEDESTGRSNRMANELLRDGYIMAFRTTDSYQGSVYEIGFLNPDGTWRVPLSKEHPFLAEGLFERESFLEHLTYCQEGILQFYWNDGYTFYYNINSNTLHKLDDFDSWEKEFYNGVSFADSWEYRNGCQVHCFYALFPDGTTKLLGFEWQKVCFYDRQSNQGCAIDLDDRLIDIEGNLIKDFGGSLYDVTAIPESGMIQLVFSTENNKFFYTKADKTGKFLFDPVELKDVPLDLYGDYSLTVSDTNGNMVGYGDSTLFVVDDTGKVLYRDNHAYNFGVNNGIVKNGDSYVDVKK